MKSMVKKIFLILAVVLCCGIVLLGVVWCASLCNAAPCTQVCIEVADSLERRFVDTHELTMYLESKGYSPQGRCVDSVDCHAIEQCLLTHDMVRDVCCYKSPFGKIHIAVNQRIPVMRVESKQCTYYVDSDRRVMPTRETIQVQIPVFSGEVTTEAASGEYFDFVVWLNQEEYWGKRIQQVHVVNPTYLVLLQENDSAKILLGELDGYENKLAKLHTLYTKGFERIGYPKYKEYDLRFAKQVVGRE